MKIGIWGTGRMGSGLGKLWAAKGHEIMFGSRSPANAQRLAQSMGANVQGGSVADAAAFGEVLLLAIPWTSAEEMLKSVGSLKGKTLIDLMNSWGSGWMPAIGHTTSVAEQVATWAPDAHVVKAFNGIYAEHLGNSKFEGYDESLFFCGDNADSKAKVAQLGRDAGLDPVDCGELAVARLVEPLAFLWMQLAFNSDYGSEVALRLLRR